jgi:hydrogen peroxide-dependent heme synthase
MFAIPPATLEGWYVLHQTFSTNWSAVELLGGEQRRRTSRDGAELFQAWAEPPGGGWSAAFRLVAGSADWLFVHFRPTLEELADLQLQWRTSAMGRLLTPVYDYLSMTEAGLYHATAEAARVAEPRSAEFEQLVAEAAEAELRSPHVRTRLFPAMPEGMRYVSFYPMNKRRSVGQNWYALPLEERNRLMREHGLTGRRYAGRVFQIISGSIGLDDWEWGVTLFARDPLEFKRIVTEMRFDEASAVYADFGQFLTGIRLQAEEWPRMLGVGENPR